jgi:hypothetical protein
MYCLGLLVILGQTKNCRPERSRTVREVTRSAESKARYALIDRRVAQAFDLAGISNTKGVPLHKIVILTLSLPKGGRTCCLPAAIHPVALTAVQRVQLVT